jgi:pantoate--beta-alanine ligase
MPVIYSASELSLFLGSNHSNHHSLGFVPTMGALHQGHLSLMHQSLVENDITVVSIFVNPTQFNNPEDLKKYPRTLEADVQKIETLSQDIIVFAPSVSEMYGQSPLSDSYSFDGLEFQMEGKFRPGHFDGVGTIVHKLFAMVKPTRAYFGEKDFQQLRIIQTLVKNLVLPIQIVPCPIYREANGLAMSSRNERLPEAVRAEAGFIYELLQDVKKRFPTNEFKNILDWVVKTFENHEGFELEYFEICDEFSLTPLEQFNNTKKYRAFIALNVSNVRLIDNISLN